VIGDGCCIRLGQLPPSVRRLPGRSCHGCAKQRHPRPYIHHPIAHIYSNSPMKLKDATFLSTFIYSFVYPPHTKRQVVDRMHILLRSSPNPSLAIPCPSPCMSIHVSVYAVYYLVFIRDHIPLPSSLAFSSLFPFGVCVHLAHSFCFCVEPNPRLYPTVFIHIHIR